ncbi:hypothetical protein K3Z87_17825 [Pseudomonas aeruginosa]|nr:hypothetical protein [Pseudomonas aeruginosa]
MRLLGTDDSGVDELVEGQAFAGELQSTGDFAELVRQQRQEQAQATVFVEPSLQFQATPPAVTAQRLRLQALDAVRL